MSDINNVTVVALHQLACCRQNLFFYLKLYFFLLRFILQLELKMISELAIKIYSVVSLGASC